MEKKKRSEIKEMWDIINKFNLPVLGMPAKENDMEVIFLIKEWWGFSNLIKIPAHELKKKLR